MASRLVGGHLDIRATDDFNRTMARLLSPGTLTKRVALLDNVMTLRFSWSDLEALVSGSRINGHLLYVGDSSRPNTLTWFITMNGANMSKDRFPPTCSEARKSALQRGTPGRRTTERDVDSLREPMHEDELNTLPRISRLARRQDQLPASLQMRLHQPRRHVALAR